MPDQAKPGLCWPGSVANRPGLARPLARPGQAAQLPLPATTWPSAAVTAAVVIAAVAVTAAVFTAAAAVAAAAIVAKQPTSWAVWDPTK